MARPTRKNISAGQSAWDAPLNDDLIALFDEPTPVPEHSGDQTDLASTFPAAQYDRCLVWVNHTAWGWTLYFSDGTNWQVLKLRRTQRVVSGAGNINSGDDIILAGGAAPYTLTLPNPANVEGEAFTVKQTGTGAVTVGPNGAETIDGAANYALPAQYAVATFISDGTNWHIVSF